LLYKIDHIQVPVDFDEGRLSQWIEKKLKLPAGSIIRTEIARKSLDARYKRLSFIYSVIFAVNLADSAMETVLEGHPEVKAYQLPERRPVNRIGRKGLRPVIVGAGPAGLFAGLRLAEAGMEPLIIERGDGLIRRIEAVERFWYHGILDPESNIQYGVGGAGTFSDGKLTTRVKNPAIPELLELLVDAGAPPEIRYWQYPHVGTDRLREVIDNLQKRIIDYGGEIRFRHRLTGISCDNKVLNAVEINGQEIIPADCLILATGNSARDIYRMLYRLQFPLEAKAFAVGVRIEHPQDLIDRAQYGPWAGHRRLGPAEYHLTYKHALTGKGVYTFCMCPGGVVVGAASEPGGVVTNGMSYHARDSKVANAAIVATVTEKDYGDHSPLAGMEYQIALEQAAYRYGGNNFMAPAQRVGDFLKEEPTSEFTKLSPSYLPGTMPANLWDVLPRPIAMAIRDGIRFFGTRLKGFDWPDAVLTVVETRTSAPVRIVRGEDLQAVGYEGIYPCGEGAGYAGGIVSSALDGWKVADRIIDRRRMY